MNYGWAIQTTRCGHLDPDADTEVYAVNLVTPWCDDSSVGGRATPFAVADVQPPSEMAVFFPWLWTSVKWHVYASPAAYDNLALLTVLAASSGMPPAPVPAALLAALRNEVLGKIKDCAYLFSIDPADLGDPARPGLCSLPHALAPLGHWPAGMSNAALKLAGFLSIPSAALDAASAKYLVCVPELRLPADAAVRMPASPVIHNGNLGFLYGTTPTLMVSRPCARASAVNLAAATAPPATLPGPSIPLLRSHAANELTPLAILMSFARQSLAATDAESIAFVASAAADPLLKAGWSDALHAYIPDGWGPEYVGIGALSHRDHVLSRLGVTDIAGLTQAPVKTSDMLSRALAKLAGREINAAWSKADKLYWNQASRNYAQLGALTQGSDFLRAWLDIAQAIADPLAARHLMGPWLAELYAANLPAAALDPLRSTVLFTEAQELARIGLLTAHSAPPVTRWLNGGATATPTADDLAVDLPEFNYQHRLGDLIAPHTAHTAMMKKLADGFLQRLASREDASTPVPRDAGLVLQFEQGPPLPDFDQSVRGYAIALCSFLPGQTMQWLPDTGRANWITNTALLDRSDLPVWAQDSDGTLWWLHETIGSTLQNGLRTTRVTYEERPVAAMLAHASGAIADHDSAVDMDGSSVVDFLWPDHTPHSALPMLGYGMHYGACCTCLDNAGGIAAANLRGASFAQLKPASELFSDGTPPQWHYRSAVPPGAPVPRSTPPAGAYEWSRDTRAHAHAAWRSSRQTTPTDAPLVALLVHQQNPGLFKAGPATAGLQSYRIAYAAPAASAVFIERWLNTDIALLEAGAAARGTVSDAVFAAQPAAVLAAFKSSLLAAFANPDALPSYHPAVTALGVAIWFNEDTTPLQSVHLLERVRYDTATGFTTVSSTVEIAILSAPHNDVSLPGTPGPQVQVALAPGSYARVRVFSLVDEAYFSDVDSQRFYASIQGGGGGFAPPFAGYRAFGPAEQFFETAPAWQAGTTAALALHVRAPGQHDSGVLAPDNAVMLHGSMPGTPEWIRGLYVQRHEWHWTGYPVRLPQGDQLQRWLTSLEGVESYREASESVLSTAFPAPGAWAYGANGDGEVAILTRQLPAGARPARYTAFTARPTLRFRSLLDESFHAGPLSLERNVFAAAALLAGIGPQNWNERMPTPPLRWAVPLTSTYAAGDPPAADNGLRRIASGNLLIFDDALRRTDQLSRIGGIGDTLEVDLLETRVDQYREIGSNPIFHPNLTAAEHQALGLDVQPPFGLTQDIGSNPMVGQTALVVRPLGGQGKWLLAKVRARRLILPETQLRSLEQQALLADFPVRREGNDQLPLDFALDFDAVPTPTDPVLLTIRSGATSISSAWPAKLPANGQTQPLRLLCSWHKGRWAAGDPVWRLQVLVQCRKADEMDWLTVDKLSVFANKSSTLAAGLALDKVQLIPTTEGAPRVSVVRMSDYTAPVWLTFIGGFGRESLSMPGEYRLTGTLDALKLTPHAAAATMPVLSGIDEVKSPCFQILLLYRSLVDVTRGDTRADTGAMVGVYCFSRAQDQFARLKDSPADPGAATPDGCFAYLCSVQRITSPSHKEQVAALASFDDLMQQLFNGERESTMRLLPEFIGPIPATSLA